MKAPVMLLHLKQQLNSSWLDGHRYRAAILITLFTFLVTMPAILNGKPFLYYDSAQYFDIGKAISNQVVSIVTGHDTEAATDGISGVLSPQSGSDAGTGTGKEPADEGGLSAIAGGRSPVYSLIVYVLSSSLSTFAVVALQGLITSWVLFRFLEMTIGPGRSFLKVGLVAGLSFLTPLGFHVGFVMPDIFGGLFVASSLILMFDRHLSQLNTYCLVALIAVSATMHTTIIPLGMVLVVLTLLIRLLPERSKLVAMSAAGWIGASLIMAILLQTGYGIAAKQSTGDEVRSPPYLLARVIADGPGERFLNERCSGGGYTVCDFRGIDFVDHNDFLWGGSGAKINFSTSDKITREELKEEELAFVGEVVLTYPIQQFLASLNNAIKQFTSVGIPETSIGVERIILDPSFANAEILNHQPGISSCREASRGCRFDNPIRKSWGMTVHYSTLALILSLLVWTIREIYFAHSSSQKDAGVMLAFISGTFLTVLVANAAVCGILSAPHDRYQARLAWICALVLASGLLNRRSMLIQARDAAA